MSRSGFVWIFLLFLLAITTASLSSVPKTLSIPEDIEEQKILVNEIIATILQLKKEYDQNPDLSQIDFDDVV